MFLLMSLALSSQAIAIRALVDQDLRLATIGDRLARGGAALCPGQATSTAGLVIQDARQYGQDQRAAARSALGLGKGPTIVALVAASDAPGAGSEIAAVGGQAVLTDARDAYADVERTETLIEEGFARGPVRLTLGSGTVVTLAPQTGCRSRFQIVAGGLGRTMADGRYVKISDAMMRTVANDDELAVVTAHELAHNILRHRVEKTPSKQAEYEADRLSVWLVARAGYDTSAIVPFWTRLGRRTDYGIFSDGTHPGWKKRVARVGEAVALVERQRATGAALLPPVEQQSASQADFRR